MTAAWRLLACRGCGSAIVELALTLAKIPYEREEVDYSTEAGRARLLPHNPLAQVPTVILPDGTVMTESLALIFAIDDQVPAAGLVPTNQDPLRPIALRWLTFIVAAIYPTFTYGDDVAKWGGGDAMKAAIDAHRLTLWNQMEANARGPWFLGPRFSAIDLYIAVMTYWRPRQAWFETNAPKLYAIARTAAQDPRIAAVLAANGA